MVCDKAQPESVLSDMPHACLPHVTTAGIHVTAMHSPSALDSDKFGFLASNLLAQALASLASA
jgi:hypothetical protein